MDACSVSLMWRNSPSALDWRYELSRARVMVFATRSRKSLNGWSRGRCGLSDATRTPSSPSSGWPSGSAICSTDRVASGAAPTGIGVRDSVTLSSSPSDAGDTAIRRFDATSVSGSPARRYTSAASRSSLVEDSARAAATHTLVGSVAPMSDRLRWARHARRRWATTDCVVSLAVTSTPPTVPSSSNTGL